MNLIFRQDGQFSIYSEEVIINGKFKTKYIIEMVNHKGLYAIEETYGYFSALRLLAEFKQKH